MVHYAVILSAVVLSVACSGCVQGAATPGIPWPEHPRPDFKRSPWVNLNGPWQFEFDPNDVGEKEKWFVPGTHEFTRTITVPFPWESKLSGIGDTEYKGVAWYAREITLPTGEDWERKGRKIALIIGACDWEAKVWVNGQPAAEHVGGYTPFDVDLSQFAKPGEKATIVVRAVDHTDAQQPTGKQINWYTRTSGIWQTVYLEPRGSRYVESVRAVPDVESGTVRFSIVCPGVSGGGRLVVRSPDDAFDPVELGLTESGGDAMGKPRTATIKLKAPKPWTPDSPILYPVIFEVSDVSNGLMDRVESYFGLREIGVADAPGRDYQYICLNGKPIYLRGALHQSFHPDGIYQYPDDATMRSDYELCNRIGINFLRIHIKAPIPRELYWADRLGVLIMQDMPNYWVHSQQAMDWYEQMLREVIERDFNHPAIFSWCDFNETWGIGHEKYDADRQRWVEQMYHLTKAIDPTRLVEDNSPCRYDHVITDINSWHFYINDYAKARRHIREVVDKTHPGSTFNYIGGRRQANAPLMNSEYGGISAGLGDQDISWCFKYLTNELRSHDKICGYIYTELSDIEWEHNGLANYDRSAKEYGYEFWHPGFALADINNPDFVVIDAPPCLDLEPGESRELPIKISHWSDRQAKALQLRWRVDWLDRFGERTEGRWQSQAAEWKPFAVVGQPAIRVTVDAQAGRAVGALLVELLDGKAILARNYVNTLVDRASPRVEVLDEKRVALRFDPADLAGWKWPPDQKPQFDGIAAGKLCARGAGYVEYRLQLPADVEPDDLDAVELMAELSAKAGDEKLAWPARKKPVDYPQTDVKKWPTDVRIRINGIEVHRQTLDDDPADARGMLSHLRQHHPGSYGWLVRAGAAGTPARKIAAAMGPDRRLVIRFEVPADAEHRGGLAIFGDGLGRYPVAPTCILRFERPHGLAPGFTSDGPVAVDRMAEKPPP